MYGEPLVSAYSRFGYRFFGPLLLDWYNRLTRTLDSVENSDVYCLGREGWTLVPLFNAFSALHRQGRRRFIYLQTSRALLTHISLSDSRLEGFGFNTAFDGTVREFFEFRLGVTFELLSTASVGDQRIRLPRDREYLFDIYSRDRRLAIALAGKTRQAYGSYLADRGITADRTNLLSDLGFRGTTQALMTAIYGLSFKGHYALLDQTGVADPLNLPKGSTVGLFSDSKSFGEGFGPLDQSLLLEAFLTAPFGQVIGMQLAGDGDPFLYRSPGPAQHNFEIISGTMEGALKFGYDNIDLIGAEAPLIDDLAVFFDEFRFSLANSLLLFAPILEIDDSYFGNEIATARSKL